MISFNEWVKLNEGKNRIYNTSEPRQSDTERLRSGKSIKIDAAEKKPRIPVGKPAKACSVSAEKKKYNRSKFKRIDY
jgi:hypothetical protein